MFKNVNKLAAAALTVAWCTLLTEGAAGQTLQGPTDRSGMTIYGPDDVAAGKLVLKADPIDTLEITAGVVYAHMGQVGLLAASDTGAPVGADDYDSINDGTIDLGRFRFIGGVAAPGQVVFFDFFDSGLNFVDGFGVALPMGGNFAWSITINPTIAIPDTGAVQMTADAGATATWFVGTEGPTVGTEDVNMFGAGNGTHSFLFELTNRPAVAINEARIDQTGTDNDEYFELAGPAGQVLDGLTYIVIGDGGAAVGSGVIEEVTSLSGQVIPGSGFFLAGEGTLSLGVANLTTDLNFENADNVTHMIVSGFTGADAQDLDTNDDGTLDVVPWAQVVDCVALVGTAASEQIYCATVVGPDGTFSPGHVYRCEDQTGAWLIGAFDPVGGQDTPGAANDCSFADPCDECATTTCVAMDGTQNGETAMNTFTIDTSCGDALDTPDEWWAYTASCTGTATADTIGTGDDTILAVFTDDCSTEIICDDDGGSGFPPGESLASWAATAGTTYRIRVSGWGGATLSSYVLNVDCVEPPPTGACCFADGTCTDGGIEADCVAAQAYTATVNTPIPDNSPAGMTSILNVPDSGSILDLDIQLGITHTWVGDLCITLTHPNGIDSAQIVQRAGGNVVGDSCHQGSPFGCSANNYNGTIVDDEGTVSLEATAAPGCILDHPSPPNYLPFSPLSVFDGLDQAGDWVLTVSDNGDGDTGSLDSWTLLITGTAGVQPVFTPNVLCADLVPPCGCGNGTVDAGEDCDDGNNLDGDCCSASCTFEIAGSACGDPSVTDCDGADTCDGAGACQDNLAASGTACGDPSVTDCDGADTCDGAGACQDNLAAAGTNCGDGPAECSDQDTCDGSGGCQPNHSAAGTNCGDGPTVCSGQDTCNGTGGCQPNHSSTSTECRPAVDACDIADFCDGAGACSADATVVDCINGDGCCPAGCTNDLDDDCPILEPPVPAISQLGMVILAVLLVLGIGLKFRRRTVSA